MPTRKPITWRDITQPLGLATRRGRRAFVAEVLAWMLVLLFVWVSPDLPPALADIAQQTQPSAGFLFSILALGMVMTAMILAVHLEMVLDFPHWLYLGVRVWLRRRARRLRSA